MKIAYAGFDLFYPMLESLFDSGCEIVKIYTNKVDNITEFNTHVTEFAKAHNIEISYDKITLSDLEELKENGVDALFCAAYYYRIPILEDFKMINVHPSLLPLGRGAWPMPLCILNKCEKSGVTFHKMEESFDTGEILMQEEFTLDDNETLYTYMEKIYSLLPNMVSTLLGDFEYYYNNAKAQGEGVYEEAPDEHDYVIDKNTDFSDADRISRAFSGFYVIYRENDTDHRLLNAVAIKGDNKNEKFKIKDGYLKVISA